MPSTTQDPAPRLDQHADEWARLQTSLHTRAAIQSLRTAATAVEGAMAAHPRRDPDLDVALERLRGATMALGRVDARVHTARLDQ